MCVLLRPQCSRSVKEARNRFSAKHSEKNVIHPNVLVILSEIIQCDTLHVILSMPEQMLIVHWR